MLEPMHGREDGAALSRAEAARLLGWWLEAGVDVAVGDEPRNWLAGRPRIEAGRDEDPGLGDGPPAAGPQAPHPEILRPHAEKPTSLEAFHGWLAETAELPLFRAGASRALPHGPAEAEIMLLSGIPAPEDVADGRPIAGAAFELTKRMLAAIGLDEAQAYVAALTCFTGAGSRLSQGESEACRDALLHQIALAAPKRLLLFGEAPARLLLDASLAQARGKVHRLHGIPTVVTFHPRHLLGRSADKGLAWRDLLLLMGEHP